MYLGVAFTTAPPCSTSQRETPDKRIQDDQKRHLEQARQAGPEGLVPFSLYSFIISAFSCSRFSGPLYFTWSFFISGCRRCMASIDLVLLMVTGVSASMMTTVRPKMAMA